MVKDKFTLKAQDPLSKSAHAPGRRRTAGGGLTDAGGLTDGTGLTDGDRSAPYIPNLAKASSLGSFFF